MDGNVMTMLRAQWLRCFLVVALGLTLLQPLPTSADQAQYIYDDLDRLSQVIDGQGNVATYTYDAVGNLLSITRNTGGVGAEQKRGQATFREIYGVARVGAAWSPGPR